MYGKQIKENVNIGTRATYADISATILELFNMNKITGTSFKDEILE